MITLVPVAELGDGAKAAIIGLCSEALGTDCSTLVDYLSDSTHVLAHADRQLVGHACWTTRQLRPAGLPPLRTAWVDAVTVVPVHQQQGIGSTVMRRLMDATVGYQLCALGTDRMAFFERLGWERWHGSAVGVLHDPLDTLMIRRTPTTPQVDTTGQITAA